MKTLRLIKNTPPEIAENSVLVHIKNGRKDTYPLSNTFSIGRSIQNQLSLGEESISRRHCRIEKHGSQYIVRDLNSANGTFLNSARVTEAILNNDDILQVGEHFLIFTAEQESKISEMFSSENTSWAKNLELLPNIAQSHHPLLVLGPSGSGKDCLARQVHQLSQRRWEPYISINCSALSESLIESELFGHNKGSYTGATTPRLGAFRAANNGVLFLDEIGDLPLSCQPKLLRAIENQEIKPVGSDKTHAVNVRIIAATHNNLKEKVAKGQFRQDLYFRLNILNISLPPLKERMEDFETLIRRFCRKEKIGFSHRSFEKLKAYSWPGNIRELKNVIARASVLFRNKLVMPEDLPLVMEPLSDQAFNKSTTFTQSPTESLTEALKNMEKQTIEQQLFVYKGNQSKTARALGLPRTTLHDKVQMYNIDVTEFKPF